MRLRITMATGKTISFKLPVEINHTTVNTLDDFQEQLNSSNCFIRLSNDEIGTILINSSLITSIDVTDEKKQKITY